MHDDRQDSSDAAAGRARPAPGATGPGTDPRTGRAAAAARIQQQASWVDLQIRQAMDRGDFDGLPGYGKPLEGLDGRDDPDWWVKQLIEREQVTGVLPPSLQIRREDAELDRRLDRLGSEAEVRREVAEFNDRVRWTLYRPPEGPPMVTSPRDPVTEVARWRDRRAAAAAAARERARTARQDRGGSLPDPRRRPRGWRRILRRGKVRG